MPYTTNPHLPKLRMQAVLLVRQGWSIRKVARYIGVQHTTVLRWIKKAPLDGRFNIPTLSSARHSHPNALKPEIIRAIVDQRKQHGRCCEVVHQELQNLGIKVSLSSVKRVLDRHNLLRKNSPWKKLHFSLPRPIIEKPGDLIQVDTIHFMLNPKERFYVYTLVDVFSRWAYAQVSDRISTHRSLSFVRRAQKNFPHPFKMLQSDHGAEFSKYFSSMIEITHRHSRIRKPNDNAHLERFNRTIQDECLSKVVPIPEAYQKAINSYLPYYNNQRLHLGINLKTPNQLVRRI